MQTIPSIFGSVDDLLKRWKKAQARYDQFRQLHQEAFEFSAPNRENFNTRADGESRTKQIYDSTAVNALPQFGNRIQAALMPAWMQWLEFKSGSDIPEEEEDQADEALEELTKQFFSALNQSNFYTELAPALLDLGIGTGGLLIEEEEFGKTSMFKFTCIPLHELYPEQCVGNVDSVWRKMMIAPKHIKRTWPNAELPRELEDLANKEDSNDIELLNAMLYGKDGKYHQFVLHQTTKAVLFHQTFDTQRLIVFRWSVTAGEVFGRGPIINILPDIKVANKIKEMMLQNGALQIAGVYTALDDGIFNPYTARIQAGTIMPVGSNSNQNPTLRPLDRNGDLGFADYLLQDLQDSIKKALFVGQLGEISDPTKTATELMIRQQEMLKDAGSNFGRLKSELINPLVSAIADIMRARGKFPEYKVDGKVIAIQHQSPIAKAESMEDFQAIQAWMGDMMQFMTPEQLQVNVKLEEYPEVTQKLLGVTSKLLRTDEERKQMQEQMMQQQQQQEAMNSGTQQAAG